MTFQEAMEYQARKLKIYLGEDNVLPIGVLDTRNTDTSDRNGGSDNTCNSDTPKPEVLGG